MYSKKGKRRTFKQVGNDWDECSLMDLKKGDVFKFVDEEVGMEAVSTGPYTADSDPFKDEFGTGMINILFKE